MGRRPQIRFENYSILSMEILNLRVCMINMFVLNQTVKIETLEYILLFE